MGRAFLVKQTTRDLFRTLRVGAPATRKERERVILTIVDDLCTVKQLPPRLELITPQHIKALVSFWRTQQETDATIMTKLSRLRSFNRQAGLDIVIPSNKTLRLKFPETQPSPFLTDPESLIDKVSHPLTRYLIQMQCYFGLTKTEAIRLDPGQSSKTDDQEEVLIGRDISYNNKDRVIPLLTDQQRQVLQTGLSLYHKMLRLTEAQGSQLYHTELKYLDVSPTLSLRYVYASQRLETLIKTLNDENAARTVLCHEMGISVYQLHRLMKAGTGDE